MNFRKRISQYAIATLMIFFLVGYSIYKWHDNSQLRAIIAFTDTHDVSEDWNWFFNDIQQACEGKNIFVIAAAPQAKQVFIGPKEKPLAVVALSEYYKYHQGYLFVKQGIKIKYQKYDMSDNVLKNASEYLGISLW